MYMLYIVALGNPGDEYTSTRHNVGWLVADMMRERFHLSTPEFKANYQGRMSEGVIGSEPVRLLYPDTFMNHSGAAVKKLVQPEQVESLLVIQDEIMLPLGEIKLSCDRGDGGHNGVRSIISSLGTKKFMRLRVGIAPTHFLTGKMKVVSGDAMPRYVLGKFSKKELATLDKESENITDAVRVIATHGITTAMNRFN